WIRYELGPEAMTRYFSTNRPVWGLLYQVTTRVLPQVPIYWQVLALGTRVLTAWCVWAIVRMLWPARERLALIVALLFLVYPGFNQQWTAYLYSHFFIVLGFLLLSFLCMLRSLQATDAKRRWLLTGAGVLLSALNLWMMEYFFVLELLRPFLILQFVSTEDAAAPPGERLKRTAILWAPYLAVFAANIVWRLFIFNNQIYKPTLLGKVRSAPLAALWELLLTVLRDLYEVSAMAWAQVVRLSSVLSAGPRTMVFYAAVLVFTGVLVAWALLQTRNETEGHNGALWIIALGLIAMLLAGGPFWLTGLEITLGHPANRFTLPFMLGVSLLIGGLLEYLPRQARIAIATVLIALAAGSQALSADAFRRDWTTQKALFWQMFWRAPGIKPGTTLLMNEGPLKFYADNSLTGALNWIYDPGNRSGSMEYVLFFPTSRLGGTLRDLSAGQPIQYDFISEVFTGSTSQALAFYYAPPGCLRLLDPQIDAENRLIADDSLMREAAALSSAQWITSKGNAQMPAIYGPEPAHGWCYYFERASLAAQSGDWAQVAKLGDAALQLSDHPNDPVERFVFIEGYAQTGNWSRARDMALQSYEVSPRVVGPLLCKLIARMDHELPDGEAKRSSLNDLRTKFSCLP
ncbi:MAG: hypothetical protein ACM3MF_04980, partial [Anaerolineae bacterium]